MTAATTEIEKAVLAHAAPLAALGHHPNVVLVYYCDGVEHPTTRLRVPAMVMEFIEGVSVGQLLREYIPFERAVAIGLAVSAGLLHIHGKGLVHGDLHDDNVMIPTAGGAKLIDLMNDKAISELTSGTRRLGTNDDVESLKALLTNLLRKTPRGALATTFEAAVQPQSTVAGVQAVFEKTTRETAAPVPPIADFLSAWGDVERALQDGVSGSGDEPRRVGARRLVPSVASLVERMHLEPDVRNEFNELRRIRNAAVHGEPGHVSQSAVVRARALVGLLRTQLQNSGAATPSG